MWGGGGGRGEVKLALEAIEELEATVVCKVE